MAFFSRIRWYVRSRLARHRGRQLAASQLSQSPLAALYRCWPDSAGQKIADFGLISVDLETTGLNPRTDQILSIGWVLLDHRRIYLDTARHHLVAIRGSVGQSARFHQLTDQHLAGAGEIGTALEQLLRAGAGRLWLFHHADLDLAFLDHICRQLYDTGLTVPAIDTLALEQRRQATGIRPELRLHQCRGRYNLPEYHGHCALTDALATAELWLAWRSRQPTSLQLADCLTSV